MPAVMTAPKARFAPDPRRRSLIAKVQIARKELGLVDDDYRAILVRIAGKTSAADLDETELVAVVEDLKTKGFKPKLAGARPADKRVSSARPADHLSARKARALWISLHQLGAIENASEAALEGFAMRQLGVERLQWANGALMYKLIEALKAIGERNGWSQDLKGVSRDGGVRLLKLRLCDAILAKLKARDLAAANWSLGEAAFRLLGMGEDGGTGPTFWAIGRLDALAQGLGAKLRDRAATASLS